MLPNWLYGKSKSKLASILGGGGGGGTSYTAGPGISINSNNRISFRGDTAPYNNSDSDLEADTVKGAIDELAERGGGGGTAYTAGAGIKIANSTISLNWLPNTATLGAGFTELRIENNAIHADSVIMPLTSIWGVAPKTITLSEGTAVLTFDAQQVDLEVGIIILN